MRLYRILGAAWAGTQADARRLAGEHHAPWHETDVPTDKPTLLAWLNERNVPAKAEELERLERERQPLERDPMDAEQPWIMGPVTKDPPRYSTAFLADAHSGAEFIPVTKAAEIDRHLARCPMCHNSEEAAQKRRDRLDFEGIRAWIAERATSVELDELADLVEEKRQ